MARTIAELDYRENDGIAVWLLWNRRTDEVVVRVQDTRSDEAFELVCPPDEALDRFHHPFAYAPAPARAGVVETVTGSPATR